MTLHWLSGLAFLLIYLHDVDAITWTSSSTLPNDKIVTGCRGQDLEILWGFKVGPDETLVNTEWYFRSSPQHQDKLIAYKVQDTFSIPPFVPFIAKDAHNSTWNGGIILPSVTPQNSGRYTIKVLADLHSTIDIGERQTVVVNIADSLVLSSTGFHAEMVADSLTQSASGELHLRLSCGTFTHLGEPPISIVWRTPDNTTLNSTSSHDGIFYLDVNSHHPSGDYSCSIKPDSLPLRCIDANSPLRGEARVTVSESALRTKLMEAKLSSVAQQNSNLTQLVNGLVGQVTSLVQSNAGLVDTVHLLQAQQATSQSEKQLLVSKMDNLTNELNRQKAENSHLHQVDTELMSQLLSLNDTTSQHITDLQDYLALPQNCQDVQRYNNTDGQHILFTRGRIYRAYCDQTTDGGGWTVIQRREDGSEEFYRDWRDYENGFGDVSGEHWIGLEKMYWLTSAGNYKLRIELRDFADNRAMALYSEFSVGDAEHHYALNISGYSGTAGDSLRHNNKNPFTTLDRDNDMSDTSNCAVADHGAFWYWDCTNVNLNGRYYTATSAASAGDDGVYWFDWKSDTTSLKKVVMMVKAV